MRALCEALKINETLETLDLACKLIMLGHLNNRHLHLSYAGNSFGKSGVEALSEVVKDNTVLKQLFLGCLFENYSKMKKKTS